MKHLYLSCAKQAKRDYLKKQFWYYVRDWRCAQRFVFVVGTPLRGCPGNKNKRNHRKARPAVGAIHESPLRQGTPIKYHLLIKCEKHLWAVPLEMDILACHSNKIVIMTPFPVYFTAVITNLEIIKILCCVFRQALQYILFFCLFKITVAGRTPWKHGYWTRKIKSF